MWNFNLQVEVRRVQTVTNFGIANAMMRCCGYDEEES